VLPAAPLALFSACAELPIARLSPLTAASVLPFAALVLFAAKTLFVSRPPAVCVALLTSLVAILLTVSLGALFSLNLSHFLCIFVPFI
jgi:hypothetical protein